MSTWGLDHQRRRRALRIWFALCAVLALLCLTALGAGGYLVAKHINYSLLYEGMVRATVREMVKPEALKEAP